ncbi:hypothetical protein Psed_6860 (plasmid) [Pseudonocardia dioxanivorans CB1190]|uniref:Uncharacterized protein n=1 Tax=Pseudonocardia dioxanivorans (strain ATCC 55486 / DSM 44775 / JCM 13855 / CB1190) TaxID=675635 RepID=F2L6N7_PSEUX|nr:hypothetical protein [Pseudonocardia dioxanivorans]AEA28931.1 hypothetical protein Psed_6860 [Pseudonocardia dioxanivorans CB1190]GJF02877.1 hypothetical protein PSD17_18390 [Pseudonocardia sp. D17]
MGQLVSRSQPVEVEVGPTAGEQAGPATGRAAAAERAVDQAVDQAAAADRARDERALAEPDREDKNQLALFELSDEARVGAQPLRVETETPEHGQDQGRDVEHGQADTEVRVSLAEARQQARLAQSIRELREAAEPVRAAERHRQVAEALEADRTRRDQAERDQTIHGPTAERVPEHEHSPAGAQIGLTQEQSEDWGLDLD